MIEETQTKVKEEQVIVAAFVIAASKEGNQRLPFYHCALAAKACTWPLATGLNMLPSACHYHAIEADTTGRRERRGRMELWAVHTKIKRVKVIKYDIVAVASEHPEPLGCKAHAMQETPCTSVLYNWTHIVLLSALSLSQPEK